MRRLVVQPYRPWVGLLMVALIASLGYLARERWRLEGEVVDISSRLQNGQQQLSETRLELATVVDSNAGLREQLATLDRARQVDGKAYAEVDEQIGDYQDAILALKEEVAFYRRIISADRSQGLNVQTLLVTPEPIEHVYRFELVLTRNMNNDKVTEGTATIAVVGEMDGQTAELPMAELLLSGDRALVFKFKYFQRLQRRFSLPPNFDPRMLSVRLDAVGAEPSKIERSFEWAERG